MADEGGADRRVEAGLSETVPALPVRDVEAAVRFYASRLGFPAVHEDAGFAVVRRDAAELHLWEAADERWTHRDTAGSPVRSGAESFLAGTASCRIRVVDVDGLHAELSAAGVLHPTDTGAPVDQTFGSREFSALDLDGNLLTFFRWD
ncbi:bleomycin resistance protein [Goekera deserti]|uniref:bleomycin resistance protein n=1 Tax=Goekera deserti TaxID=2497753 RepID=UPI00192ECB5F|nr:VOC family protein [Goekera deserti]